MVWNYFYFALELFGAQGSPSQAAYYMNLSSPRFCFINVVIMIYLFVLYDLLIN